MVLGSKAYFPHLTFAYISICQAQHVALQLFTTGTMSSGQGCSASIPGPPQLLCQASWPCSTLCCSTADMAQEAILTAQLVLLGSGNTNPFSNPSWKRGSKEARCVPCQNLFPGNHLHSNMPEILLPGSGEHSHTLG